MVLVVCIDYADARAVQLTSLLTFVLINALFALLLTAETQSILRVVQSRAARIFVDNTMMLPPMSDDQPLRHPHVEHYIQREFRPDLHAYESKIALGNSPRDRQEFRKASKGRPYGNDRLDMRPVWIDGERAFDGSALVAVGPSVRPRFSVVLCA